jgi:nucleotide-sensitive chloride channel 1A
MNSDSCGVGELYILNSKIIWYNGNKSSYQINYPNLSLHAISRDTSNFPYSCIYCLIDNNINPNEQKSSLEEDQESNEILVTEVRLIAKDDNVTLEQIFQSIADGQALNPDPQEEDDLHDLMQ